MNIFILDQDLQLCARYHCDKHVVKMPLEYAQMLSAVLRKSGIDVGYRLTHANHPCTLWAGESLSNWRWLRDLAQLVNAEYQYRYQKEKSHASWELIQTLPEPKIPDLGLTSHPQCMPEAYRDPDAVQAYRRYYVSEKLSIAKWSGRNPPEWFIF